MASQSAAQNKPISRWGTLLQQAVAGVESRLDNILADEGHTPKDVANVENISQPGKRETMNMPAMASSSAGMFPLVLCGRVVFNSRQNCLGSSQRTERMIVCKSV